MLLSVYFPVYSFFHHRDNVISLLSLLNQMYFPHKHLEIMADIVVKLLIVLSRHTVDHETHLIW